VILVVRVILEPQQPQHARKTTPEHPNHAPGPQFTVVSRPGNAQKLRHPGYTRNPSEGRLENSLLTGEGFLGIIPVSAFAWLIWAHYAGH